MKPVETQDTNITLTLPGYGPEHNLPAERCRDEDGQHFFRSTWQPDPVERLALAGGGNVLVDIRGAQHPPIGLAVEPVPGEITALAVDHVTRALGHLHAQLENYGREYEGTASGVPIPDQFLQMWTKAVAATYAQEPDPDAGPEGPPTGNPADPRTDDKPEPETHTGSVDENYDGAAWATCSCGWQGPEREDVEALGERATARAQADQDLRDHYEQAGRP